MASVAQTRHGNAMEHGDAKAGLGCAIGGNRIAVIETGPERRAALIALIDGAQVSLKLYYYMFESDRSGRLILARLIRALRRGVRVTLMVDAFGSGGTAQGFFDIFVKAGGQFGWFGARRSTRYLIRNHQKLAIADDARLIIGGFNVGDAYFAAPQDGDGWHDMGLSLDGPEVAAMVRWYRQLWRWVASRKQSFRMLRALVRRWRPDAQPSGALLWLIGGPTQRLSPWAQVMKRDLERGSRLDMVEAYFSPGQGMLRRIRRLARRGGARLVLPARSDNGATVAAARLLYGPLLKRGVEIYEYQPCKLHMKLIIVDDAVYIGSANFDMRSLFLNLELMLRIEDRDFAEQMRGFVTRQTVDSQPITPQVHAARRGPFTLLIGWISYLMVGVMDYTVTRGLNFRRRDTD